MTVLRPIQDFGLASARLHAKLPAYRRAAERADVRVREALAKVPGTWALGCSGGKDSTAMLEVAVEAGWRGPLLHFAYSGDYDPAPTENARRLADRHGLELDLLVVPSEMDAFDRAGRFFPFAVTAEERAILRWWETSYKRLVAARQAERGWAGVMIGMRREESRRRAMVLAKKGALYQVKDRPGWTCCPLMDWTGRDVWAAIASCGAPYLARYDDASDRIAERSDDCWLGVNTWARGQGADIRRRHPEAWRTLQQRFPELASNT